MQRTTIAIIALSLCCMLAFAKDDAKKTKAISASKAYGNDKQEKTISAAREYVKGKLKDPDSARFKNEVVSGRVVCGEVNSKNSYGGYVGFKRFIAHNDGSVVAVDSDETNLFFDGWWTANCFLTAAE